MYALAFAIYLLGIRAIGCPEITAVVVVIHACIDGAYYRHHWP